MLNYGSRAWYGYRISGYKTQTCDALKIEIGALGCFQRPTKVSRRNSGLYGKKGLPPRHTPETQLSDGVGLFVCVENRRRSYARKIK